MSTSVIRPIGRITFKDDMTNGYVICVTANEAGLLRVNIAGDSGIPIAPSYVGLTELDLPLSVAHGGGSNKAIMHTLRGIIQAKKRCIKGFDMWVEGEPGAEPDSQKALEDQDLRKAVASLLLLFIEGNHYDELNPYKRDPVLRGIEALGTTEADAGNFVRALLGQPAMCDHCGGTVRDGIPAGSHTENPIILCRVCNKRCGI